MSAIDSFVQGTVFYQEELSKLAQLLDKSGLPSTVGPWALRLFEPPSRFKIAYIGNLTPDTPFEVSVDGYEIPLDTIAEWCERVAHCLREARVRFEMTHFTTNGEEIRVYE